MIQRLFLYQHFFLTRTLFTTSLIVGKSSQEISSKDNFHTDIIISFYHFILIFQISFIVRKLSQEI